MLGFAHTGQAMVSAYKLVKNYTLPLAAVVLLLSVVGLVLGFHLLQYVNPATDLQATKPLGVGPGSGWDQLLGIVAAFGALLGAWYVGEQVVARRKFERLLDTDKRSEFVSNRKDLEQLTKRLPDHFKPRFAEKEASFKSSRR